MEHLDLLIVGAGSYANFYETPRVTDICTGWHGLAMAKTYLEVSPDAKVAVVDSSASVGGTWAKERLYPGLKTNNVVGSYEFSDFPLDRERYGLKEGQHIPGAVVHRYLCDFVAHYDLPVRLRTDVVSATLLDTGKWQMSYRVVYLEDGGSESKFEDPESQLITDKLVLATGLTSEPSVPTLQGQEKFRGRILHSKQLESRAADIAQAKTVVILGGNKSAWDACYNAARSGVQVHMVMRPSGGGPSRVWPVQLRLFGFFMASISRLSSTRLWSWLDPSPFGAPGWRRWFIHRTALGRWISSLFWNHLDYQVNTANDYEGHPATTSLRPWTSTLWMGNSLGVHNYETNWFELVKQGKIIVHVADVTTLRESTLCLSDGTEVTTDIVICCTGWKAEPTIKFLPEGLGLRLGLPTSGTRIEETVADRGLKARVRKHVLAETPSLHYPPVRALPQTRGSDDSKSGVEASSLATPFRLYRFLVPYEQRFLEDRSFAVIGAHLSIHAILLAQVQALWITAFFQRKIPGIDDLSPETLDRIKYGTFYHAEYERLRHPKEAGGSGDRYPDLVFDSIPYVDMLLEDLGIKHHRKPSWWREVFEPYRLADYRGLCQYIRPKD